MGYIKSLETGTLGLIQEQKNGDIKQIGLTVDQSRMLQLFMANISNDKPLIALPKEYDLIIKK